MNQKATYFLTNLDFLTEMGYSAWGPFVHAWHETGRFDGVIGQHNYFGIACYDGWKGMRVSKRTTEYDPEKGNYEIIRDFCDWPDIKTAFIFYDNTIKHLYTEAYAVRSDPYSYFHALDHYTYHWGTDKDYSAKLSKLYEIMKLDPQVKEFIIEDRKEV